MSKGTKLFGFTIPVSQNVLAGGILALVTGLGVYTYFGNGGEETAANPPSDRPAANPKLPSNPSRPVSTASAARRREASNKNKQGVLKIKPVDPSALIDPTLKLAMLDRVRSVKLVENGRNLFDSVSDAPVAQNLPKIPAVQPMMPKPMAEFIGPKQPPPKPPPPPVNIPLRYYGFVRPQTKVDGNRGYFMDGDQILMATEGDVLKSRFLVVALSPNVARVEDIQLKQGQDLQLIPEAVVMQ